jgi:hypothetical protein
MGEVLLDPVEAMGPEISEVEGLGALVRPSKRISLLTQSSSLASLILADSFFSRPERRSVAYFVHKMFGERLVHVL